jgi:hypothetical protein
VDFLSSISKKSSKKILQIPGPTIQTLNDVKEPAIVVENIMLVQSRPERLAVWTGRQLKYWTLP